MSCWEMLSVRNRFGISTAIHGWTALYVHVPTLYRLFDVLMLSIQISMPQGNVDLTFRVKGHKGRGVPCPCLRVSSLPVDSGTVYFTSIRRAKGEPFTIRASLSRIAHPTNLHVILIPVRFRVIKDDGQVVNIPITQPANLLASPQS